MKSELNPELSNLYLTSWKKKDYVFDSQLNKGGKTTWNVFLQISNLFLEGAALRPEFHPGFKPSMLSVIPNFRFIRPRGPSGNLKKISSILQTKWILILSFKKDMFMYVHVQVETMF